MGIALRCRCGKLEGEVDATRVKARAICYCKDCQAFARFLAPDGSLLDSAGGTEVEAMLPAGLRFTKGVEHLACMSLSPKGIYRWYASCCNTPVGNTPRNPKASYLGLVRTCLAAAPEELDRQLGSGRMTANTESAHAPVKATPFAVLRAVPRLGAMLVGARIGGGWRENPFFDAAGAPVRAPRVLSREERAAVTP